MHTRRHFLALSSAALAAAVAPKHLLAQTAGRLGPPPFSNAALGAAQQGLLTKERFEGLIGSSFHAFLDGDLVAEIVLRKVAVPTVKSASTASSTAQAARPAARKTNAFMLSFGTGSILIPQDSYVLDHGTLGSFVAFLVPGKSLAGDQTAIATFNYL